MNKVLYFNDLFSIYKGLLTEKEQEIFSLYYEENYSMGEIAENKKISRSSIGKTVKTVENKLEEYERILKMNYKKQQIYKVLEKGDKKMKKEIERIFF